MFIIGLMSGTSLDGVDLAYCEFRDTGHYTLLAAETVPYPPLWRNRLATLHRASAVEYALADSELGHYLGALVVDFRRRHPGPVDCIASHGHTVFHQPQLHMTAQIGDGNAIHAITGLPVVYDFRRLDVALGGQGAPLVPIGDRLLFADYAACLNLGGFANISYQSGDRRLAFDISPCNMALNALAGKAGMAYDADGALARQGALIGPLYDELESLPYYHMQPPKSLGKEWYESEFQPLMQRYAQRPLEDRIHTVAFHIASRIGAVLRDVPPSEASPRVLVTGGGAHNSYLIQCVQKQTLGMEIVVPDPLVVDYKEAIIFALLGYMRITGQDNTLASVTDARRDSCGGVLVGWLRVGKECGSDAVGL